VWRAVAAGLSVVIAAVSGVVTTLVTAHPSVGLWASLCVVVLVGAGLQAVATLNERRQRVERHNSDAAAAADVTAKLESAETDSVRPVSNNSSQQRGGIMRGHVEAGLVDGTVIGVDTDQMPHEGTEGTVRADQVGAGGQAIGIQVRHRSPGDEDT
jgi:hypothetical protein